MNDRVEKYGKYVVVHDNNKSGALLAWEWFHPGTEVPKLIQHIDDRDRWQFKLDGSKELHAALRSYEPWSFAQWQKWLRDFTPACGGSTTAFNAFKGQGAAILRAQDAHVKHIAGLARKCCIFRYQTGIEDGYEFKFNGLAANAPIHQSEIGHELANASGTFGLVWYLGDDGRCKCSLRSNGDYDVSGIARAFGGGGHRNAAGFETDITTLMGWLK